MLKKEDGKEGDGGDEKERAIDEGKGQGREGGEEKGGAEDIKSGWGLFGGGVGLGSSEGDNNRGESEGDTIPRIASPFARVRSVRGTAGSKCGRVRRVDSLACLRRGQSSLGVERAA